MSYGLDFEKISISEIRGKIKDGQMIPSWQILLDDIDSRFDRIEAQGIKTFADLQNVVKNKPRIVEFSVLTQIPEEYLNVLRRYVRSYIAKPRAIQDFSLISQDTKKELKKLSISNTKSLFPWIKDSESRNELHTKTSISDDESLLLAKLVDVTRLRYVSATFAELLFKSGYDTVEKIRNADLEDFYTKVSQVNAGGEIYKGKFGINDMKFLIDDANFFPLSVMY